MSDVRTASLSSALDEVTRLTSDLIAIDSSNYGPDDHRTGEREIAEYAAEKLGEVGYEITFIEPAPGRASIIARLGGVDPAADALLVHGHLDVVPADASEWSVDPFSGEVRDGYIWGRGAIDMKDMIGMSLALARSFRREGVTPRRDIVFAFLADEEAGGFFGSRWLVANRPELFEGVSTAISEVGGFSVTLANGKRTYLVGTGERGGELARVTTRGTPGHASMTHRDTAITRMARIVTDVDRYQSPVVVTEPMRRLATGLADLVGRSYQEADVEDILRELGAASALVLPGLRNTMNVTMLDAGYKSNVVPSTAVATVDGRALPGHEATLENQLRGIVGADGTVEISLLPGVENPYEGSLVEAMERTILVEDSEASVLPFMLGAGTDGAAFAPLGIASYGFSPLRLPPDLDFAMLFHGIDERVPVDAVLWGTRVLHRLLADY